jgi:hypothetical protein
MGLPSWRIEIVKNRFGETWSNDYLTDLVAIADAAQLAVPLLAFERAIHQTNVNFLYTRISSTVKFDRTFRHVDHNVPGQIVIGDSLPMYCTFRLDLGTTDSDPGRKYYRAPVREADQQDGLLVSGHLGTLNGYIGTLLQNTLTVGLLVTPKGNTIKTGSFNPRIQERQLHRRRRPKMTQAQFDAQ